MNLREWREGARLFDRAPADFLPAERRRSEASYARLYFILVFSR
jgi:hypothetical protein